MWEASASTGAMERCASYSPLTRCRLPGPQEPAQAAGFPVICASAPAAKAAVASWRTWIQSMAALRRTAPTRFCFAMHPWMQRGNGYASHTAAAVRSSA